VLAAICLIAGGVERSDTADMRISCRRDLWSPYGNSSMGTPEDEDVV
jgi:hypothetical protein